MSSIKELVSKDTEIHPIEVIPEIEDPVGLGWSVDVWLITGEDRKKGYHDPQGSVAGSTFFYYRDGEPHNCNELEIFPTHWQYVQL